MPQLSRIRKLRRRRAPTCREIVVNRSQRGAAVVKRSIAAGLMCVGFGAAAVAPALADAGEDTGGAVASNNGGVRHGGPAAVPDSTAANAGPRLRRGVRVRPAPAEDDWHPDWCHFVWLAWPIDPPLPYTGNRNGLLAQFAAVQTPRAIVSGVADAGAHMSTGVAGSASEAAPPPAAAPGAAGGPVGPAVVAAAFPAAAPRPPIATPSPPPESVAPSTNRMPAGLPALPSADLGQIAAVALPGLAGIAALTALGGFLGYRQAKAGYVLRAAGTARFLQ